VQIGENTIAWLCCIICRSARYLACYTHLHMDGWTEAFMEEVTKYSKHPRSAIVTPKTPWQLTALLFCAGQRDKSAKLAISGQLANGYNMQAVQLCMQPNVGSTDKVCQHTLHSKSGEQRCWAWTTAVLLQNSTKRRLQFNVSLCCTHTSLLWSFAVPQGDLQAISCVSPSVDPPRQPTCCQFPYLQRSACVTTTPIYLHDSRKTQVKLHPPYVPTTRIATAVAERRRRRTCPTF